MTTDAIPAAVATKIPGVRSRGVGRTVKYVLRVRALEVALPGADVVFTLILFGMFIPYQAVMVPLVQLMSNLGVPSGVPSLIVLHVVYGMPITTLIFRNYYAGVPVELVEAARVDGAGMLRTYASIILPISAPALVVVLMCSSRRPGTTTC